MAADVLTFDPFKANAYSENVKFDLLPKNAVNGVDAPAQTKPAAGDTDIDPHDVTFHPEVSTKLQPSKEWELDVRGLVSTKKWLQNYGLKKNRLDLHNILPQIGFKHSDEYDAKLKRPVCSRYGNGVFQKFNRTDGKSFNVSGNKDKLKQLESRLSQAVSLYKRRLEWLTTESRRIFGVIEEKAISIVLDIKNMSPQQFDQYRSAVERVIKEQVAHVAKFNLYRSCDDMKVYKPECVPVTAATIEGAIEWLWGLDRLEPSGRTTTCEAVSKAMADNNVEAVYLFTEGSSCDGAREILKEKLTGTRLPVHVVSYNCASQETVQFLKNLTKITGGRFHAYGIVMEMDHFEGAALDPSTNQANIILRKKTFGGVPAGAGMREDVVLLFEELEEARNNLLQIQMLLRDLPENTNATELQLDNLGEERSENYMSSREWLDKYGLKAQKLGFYDILSSVAFKHQDGVVNIKEAPQHQDQQTDAVTRQKLVNARYCESFPHVRWRDGQVVHVQVTPEIHRSYENRMRRALQAIQQRLDWLQQGSRELFGTVIEDKIYLLIDTSSSMDPHIQFVKDKLFVLMQEQLRHKQKFNLISFDSKTGAWHDRLVEVNEKNLQESWAWVKNLTCKGSTNTLGAIKLAMADPNTQAIYLLTDGRPDQPTRSILAQVQLHPQVPIHTISFNCDDRDANAFLCQLAKDTGGRFHYYSDNGVDLDGPEPWESEDVRLLKQELETGYRNLEKIGQLRDECASLAWKREEPISRVAREGASDLKSAMPPLESKDLYRSEFLERPRSAPGHRFSPAPPHTPRTGRPTPRPATSHGYRPVSATGFRSTPRGHPISHQRPKSARSHLITASVPSPPVMLLNRSSKPLHAGHTKTSILRTLNSNGQFQRNEWLLPETQALFEKQWLKQQKQQQDEEKKSKKTKKRTRKLASEKSMSSKRWLAIHGLAAKKLTILDALAPTFIPHKAKYVPIINKRVLSKVFDDILPIAHASGHNRKRVRIVNPQGVDLAGYEKKVLAAVEKYKRRLNRIVWDAIPQEEKDSFEVDGPISFSKYRKELMNALERSGRPVREQDIVLLENEIKQGLIYVQQAKDLQDMAKKGGNSDSESVQQSDDDDDSPRYITKHQKEALMKDSGSSGTSSPRCDDDNTSSHHDDDASSRHSDAGLDNDLDKKSEHSDIKAASEQEPTLQGEHVASVRSPRSPRATAEVAQSNKQTYEVSYKL